MNPQSIPQAGIRAAFDRAADAHQSSRSRQVVSAQAPVSVERAIANAAEQTSVDFDFLVAQAQVESSMNPRARARTSSATGLYQFIESTWLNTMHRHGERFGLGQVSSQIGKTRSGSAFVTDPQARAEILALRNDPQIASLMAAGLAEDNRAHLVPILGRQPDHSELYLAHFLGAGGAGRFLSAMQNDPSQRADSLFRRPAAANRAVFFESNGSPRSLAGVMDFLSGKLERARANAPVPVPHGYSASPLFPPSYAQTTPPPYIIADEGVFGPQTPPVVTGYNRPLIQSSVPLEMPSPRSRAPLSNLLRSTFEQQGSPALNDQSARQIKRAYEQLRAFDL